jgi:hypothetical protein
MEHGLSFKADDRSDSQEISAYYGIRRFTIVFTKARH